MFEEISLIRLRGTAPICCLMFEEREAWKALLEICGRAADFLEAPLLPAVLPVGHRGRVPGHEI